MKKQLIVSILAALLIAPIAPLPQSQAQAALLCGDQRIIYAQDKKGTPGRDNDTAIINDRNGNRLTTVKQQRDNFVIWPATYTFQVFAGDTLNYKGNDGNHSVTFDILNSTNVFVEKVTYSKFYSAPKTINQNGFIRFNAGERAQEHNLLFLCPQQTSNYYFPIANAANNPPVWSQTANQSVSVNQLLQFSVFATDLDSANLNYSVPNLPSGAIFNPSNRTFSWTPASYQTGSYTVTFRVSDGLSAVDMNVVITVVSGGSGCIANCGNQNQPPVWQQTTNQTVNAGQQLQFSVYATDPNNDYLTYSILNLPANASFYPSTRLFTWTPGYNQTGSTTVTFRVSDGYSSVDMNVSLTVNNLNINNCYGGSSYYNYNCNPCPQYGYNYGYNYGSNYNSNYNNYYNCNTTNYGSGQLIWSQMPNQSAVVNQQLQFNVIAVNTTNGPLIYSAINLPSGAYFDAFNRRFTWTPSYNQTGTYNVVFRVTDGLNTADMNVIVYVSSQGSYYPCNQNYYGYNNYGYYASNYYGGYNTGYSPSYNYNCLTGPVFSTTIPSTTIREGQLYSATAQATCQGGYPVTYRVVSGPDGLVVNYNTGFISWTPNYNQGKFDPYTIVVGASCGGQETSQTFYLTVRDYTVVYEQPITPTVAIVPVEKLKITNIRIERGQNNDVLVLWDTNKPSTSRVIFDIFSQADRTKDFTYAFATSEDGQLTTTHLLALRQIEPQRTYYLRVVSKVSEEMAASTERAFVRLPDGTVSTNNAFGAFLLGIGGFFINPWFLLLIIIVLLLIVAANYRNRV